MRVAIFGVGGSMGRESARAIENDPGLELVCGVDPRLGGTSLEGVLDPTQKLDDSSSSSLRPIFGSVDELDSTAIEVCLDFTVASAAFDNALYCARRNLNLVIGTSGLTSEQLDTLRLEFGTSTGRCLVIPNFALGAVLMMTFAEIAARWMDQAEIIELHHDRKLDSPSGTAIATASSMTGLARSNRASNTPVMERGDIDKQIPGGQEFKETIAGARGAPGPNGVRIHSVRLPGLIAHQEVVFSSRGESLTIRHDSYDRVSFMPGVLLAIKSTSGLMEPLSVGLESILGI